MAKTRAIRLRAEYEIGVRSKALEKVTGPGVFLTKTSPGKVATLKTAGITPKAALASETRTYLFCVKLGPGRALSLVLVFAIRSRWRRSCHPLELGERHKEIEKPGAIVAKAEGLPEEAKVHICLRQGHGMR